MQQSFITAFVDACQQLPSITIFAVLCQAIGMLLLMGMIVWYQCYCRCFGRIMSSRVKEAIDFAHGMLEWTTMAAAGLLACCVLVTHDKSWNTATYVVSGINILTGFLDVNVVFYVRAEERAAAQQSRILDLYMAHRRAQSAGATGQ